MAKTAIEVLRSLVADIEAMSLGNNMFGTGNSEPVGEWECTSEAIEWPNLAILLEEAKAVLAQAEEPPKVVVVINDGVVSEVISTVPAQYGVIDYGVEGADENDLFLVPQTEGASSSEAVGHSSVALVDQARAEELYACIRYHYEEVAHG